MVGGVSDSGGAMGRTAIDAALKQMRARAAELQGGAAPAEASASSFEGVVKDAVRGIDQEAKSADELHVRALKGELDFHEVTSQIPHEVHVAVPRNVRVPQIDWPPIRGFRYSETSFRAGVDEHTIDATRVKIYSPAKTVADCFKFRNSIGTDVAIEALREFLRQSPQKTEALLRHARVDRVERVIGLEDAGVAVTAAAAAASGSGLEGRALRKASVPSR